VAYTTSADPSPSTLHPDDLRSAGACRSTSASIPFLIIRDSRTMGNRNKAWVMLLVDGGYSLEGIHEVCWAFRRNDY